MRTTLTLAIAGACLLAPSLVAAQPSSDDPSRSMSAAEPWPHTAQVSPTLPDPSTYQPDQYEEVNDAIDAPMFTSGALVFAASYGGSAIVAARNGSNGNSHLYVPIAGPWLALGDHSCDPAKLNNCDHDMTTKVLLVADGLFQAAGLVGMLDGVLQPSSHRVITRTARRDPPKFHLAPTMTNGNPGLAALGKF